MLMGWSITLGCGVQSCLPGREQAKSLIVMLNPPTDSIHNVIGLTSLVFPACELTMSC